MLRKLVLFFYCLFNLTVYSQDFSALWEGHFSYYDIKDVTQGNNKVYAAAENAIFSYDFTTSELNELTTINGLSGEIISTIHYSESYELLLIGYENGLMEIAFDNDENILSIVDIIDKPTIPPNNKKINHFNEYNDVVYISTDYGISVYDLERLEFGDTYYIGNLGSQVIVKQTTILGEYIYAACQNSNGLRKAIVASENLIDYEQWTQVAGGNFLAVQAVDNKLYAIRSNRKIYDIVDDILIELYQFDKAPLDVRSIDNKLIITTKSDVYIYDSEFNLIVQASVNDEFDTDFTSALINNEDIYIGTKDYGVLKTSISDVFIFEEIHPEGPLLNNSFSIKASSNELWVTFGDYSLTYNPAPNRKRGISHLINDEWFNISKDSIFGARNLNSISINPFDTNQVFISSFADGLLEVNDNEPLILFNQTNSGLESLIVPNPNIISIRVSASNFDSQGLLWTMTGRIEKPLKSYNPSNGQWQSYNFSSLIPDALNGEWGYSDIEIDRNGTKWIGGYNYGLIGFNENGGQLLKNVASEDSNMPTTFVTTLAVDKRNQIWIGTTNGLRVLYNTSNFFEEENTQVSQIIILEDGIPKELLFQQFVSDIEVDGSNNKWIATISSGLFYFSSDGQETIFHFTKDNSPLPSNNVIDVSIDTASGIVYVATDRGLVAFKAGGSSTQENFDSTYIYPNPVRPTFNITEDKIKIKGISDNTNIKIIDIEGNLVAEAQSRTNLRYKGYNLEIDGGMAYWNGKNLANNVVASGVYLVMLSDLDSLETKVLKIMIVR